MKELIELYRAHLLKEGCEPVKVYDVYPSGWSGNETTAKDHVLWMLNELERMEMQDMEPGSRDKISRWLGFVQGVLWSTGLYTLDELREQTRKALEG